MKSRILTLILAGVMSIGLLSCGGTAKTPDPSASAQSEEASAVSVTEATASSVESSETGKTSSSTQESNPAESEEKEVEKNGDIYILFTSDVHCGVSRGFGYAGLKRVKDTLEKYGYETILVDVGHSIRGVGIGTRSKCDAIVNLIK